MRNEPHRSRKLLRSHPKVVNHLLKEYTADQVNAEYDAIVLRYMQLANMTLQQYVDDLTAKTCKVADAYDEDTLKDVFIEGADQSISHSLQTYWETSSQASLTDIAFQAESLLAIQKGSEQQPFDNKPPST